MVRGITLPQVSSNLTQGLSLSAGTTINYRLSFRVGIHGSKGNCALVVCIPLWNRELHMKLVLSCTGLIHMVYQDKLTEEELNESLFYFGCAREGIAPQLNHSLSTLFDLDVGYATRHDKKESTKNRVEKELANKTEDVRNLILRVIKKAEEEDRIVFREQCESNSWEQLNHFLEAHNLNPLPCRDPRPYCGDRYSYPGAVERMEVANPEVKAVWR
jgi:hypothetical protein